MLGCEVLFGKTQGARVRAMVEGAVGGACPCVLDQPCPLIVPPTSDQTTTVTALIAQAVTKAVDAKHEGVFASCGV
jgi:hypothetical protein